MPSIVVNLSFDVGEGVDSTEFFFNFITNISSRQIWSRILIFTLIRISLLLPHKMKSSRYSGLDNHTEEKFA